MQCSRYNGNLESSRGGGKMKFFLSLVVKVYFFWMDRGEILQNLGVLREFHEILGVNEEFVKFSCKKLI